MNVRCIEITRNLDIQYIRLDKQKRNAKKHLDGSAFGYELVRPQTIMAHYSATKGLNSSACGIMQTC